MAYFKFECDHKNRPKTARVIKQVLIVQGLPFEIKSIFGLETDKESDSSAQAVKGQAEDESNKECTICMSTDTDCIVMPCGHMCCCMECG